jgi:hypothetical protein
VTLRNFKAPASLLADRGVPGLRDLALFSTAIDTMLHGQDLLHLVAGDVRRRDGSIRPVIEVARARGMSPVRCALSNASTKALEKWITASGKKRTDYLFPGRGVEGRHPVGQRQLNRLLKLWVVEAGLDPSDYSVESLRRTKALHILKGTGDLQTVRALLGHARIESTARYLGLKQRPTPSRSVGPSISDAVTAHRFPTDWRMTVRCAAREKRKPDALVQRRGRSVVGCSRRVRLSMTHGGMIRAGLASCGWSFRVALRSQPIYPPASL